ncbi:hypothetical protein QVD17_30678 [Tagetes erecta]|uniref:Uncharacterized protein n=1 Tax=Tagetes erecta TaxID=13708 RepID=A0AAD8NG69_TARER|nr:hypothetical protein QVD17_30678 [Tagetes erecta]
MTFKLLTKDARQSPLTVEGRNDFDGKRGWQRKGIMPKSYCMANVCLDLCRFGTLKCDSDVGFRIKDVMVVKKRRCMSDFWNTTSNDASSTTVSSRLLYRRVQVLLMVSVSDPGLPYFWNKV